MTSTSKSGDAECRAEFEAWWDDQREHGTYIWHEIDMDDALEIWQAARIRPTAPAGEAELLAEVNRLTFRAADSGSIPVSWEQLRRIRSALETAIASGRSRVVAAGQPSLLQDAVQNYERQHCLNHDCPGVVTRKAEASPGAVPAPQEPWWMQEGELDDAERDRQADVWVDASEAYANAVPNHQRGLSEWMARFQAAYKVVAAYRPPHPAPATPAPSLLQEKLDRLRREGAGDNVEAAVARNLAGDAIAENSRLRAALAGYGKHPDECNGPEGACVSHMAYEELKSQVEEAGWTWDEAAEKWRAPTPATAPKVCQHLYLNPANKCMNCGETIPTAGRTPSQQQEGGK